MPISEGIITALFCMAVVFGVLVLLWGLLRVYSTIIRLIEKRNAR